MNLIVKLIWVLLCFYLLITALVYVMQRNLLYHPTPAIELPDSIDVIPLAIESGNIKLLRINAGQEKGLLYLGGNAEQVAYSAPILARQLPDYTIYLLNYRGYSGSDGTPGEQQLYQDATSSYQLITQHHRQISIIGRSLGTGIATYLASRKPVEKLVLITPFDSIAAVAQRHYPIFPLKLLLRDRYDSLDRAKQINSPTLIMIAEQDRVIPPIHARTLAEALPPENTTVETIADSEHNTIAQHRDYWPTISKFLQQ